MSLINRALAIFAGKVIADFIGNGYSMVYFKDSKARFEATTGSYGLKVVGVVCLYEADPEYHLYLQCDKSLFPYIPFEELMIAYGTMTKTNVSLNADFHWYRQKAAAIQAAEQAERDIRCEEIKKAIDEAEERGEDLNRKVDELMEKWGVKND